MNGERGKKREGGWGGGEGGDSGGTSEKSGEKEVLGKNYDGNEDDIILFKQPPSIFPVC